MLCQNRSLLSVHTMQTKCKPLFHKNNDARNDLVSKTCSRGNRARSITQNAPSLTTTSFVHFKSDTVELRDAQSSTPNKWYVKPITTQELCPFCNHVHTILSLGKWSYSPVSHIIATQWGGHATNTSAWPASANGVVTSACGAVKCMQFMTSWQGR